jgi:Zn-dependent peptidase ImmA (M78 family)
MIRRYANAAQARAEARALLRKNNITTWPVKPDVLARALGIRIEYTALDDELSGLAHIRGGTPIVGINALHPPPRQRFTLAHEIAHVCLHKKELEAAVHVDRGSLRRDAVASAGTDPIEIEANAFASELLMPRDFVIKALGGKSIDLEDDQAVDSLAAQFKVSPAAMRFRLDSLGTE